MANHFAAYPERHGAGWVAMVRFSHRSHPWPVLDRGEPKIFPTADKARLAAFEQLTEYMNGTMRTARDEAKDRAESLFTPPAIVRQSSTKRIVRVERKKEAAR